jgi:tRNA1(Val) A37 N6-methylase TrmN6
MQTTEDHLLNGLVTILQPEKGYRVAVDPVFLASVVPAREGQKVLDLGSGTGAASFCLQARVPGCHITGLENNPDHLDLSQKSIALNHWQEHIHFMEGDVEEPPEDLPEAYFDYVIANPPYYRSAEHSASPHAHKNAAHAMEGDIGAWIETAAIHIKPNGWFFMIYPADDDEIILPAMNEYFRDIRILRIVPKINQPSKRVIFAANRSGFPTIQEVGTFVLHEENGDYTEGARAVLWDARALTMI